MSLDAFGVLEQVMRITLPPENHALSRVTPNDTKSILRHLVLISLLILTLILTANLAPIVGGDMVASTGPVMRGLKVDGSSVFGKNDEKGAMKCEECKYCETEDDEHLECRRRSPFIVQGMVCRPETQMYADMIVNESETGAIWPMVLKSHWCGEFEAKEPETKT